MDEEIVLSNVKNQVYAVIIGMPFFFFLINNQIISYFYLNWFYLKSQYSEFGDFLFWKQFGLVFSSFTRSFIRWNASKNGPIDKWAAFQSWCCELHWCNFRYIHNVGIVNAIRFKTCYDIFSVSNNYFLAFSLLWRYI